MSRKFEVLSPHLKSSCQTGQNNQVYWPVVSSVLDRSGEILPTGLEGFLFHGPG